MMTERSACKCKKCKIPVEEKSDKCNVSNTRSIDSAFATRRDITATGIQLTKSCRNFIFDGGLTGANNGVIMIFLGCV